jgi:hypothetical protein
MAMTEERLKEILHVNDGRCGNDTSELAAEIRRSQAENARLRDHRWELLDRLKGILQIIDDESVGNGNQDLNRGIAICERTIQRVTAELRDESINVIRKLAEDNATLISALHELARQADDVGEWEPPDNAFTVDGVHWPQLGDAITRAKQLLFTTN